MCTGCLHRVQLIQWVFELARVLLQWSCYSGHVTVVQFVSLYIQIQGCVAWAHGSSPLLSQPIPRRDCPGHMRRHRNGAGPVHQSEAGQSTEAVDPPACDACLTGAAGSRAPWWGPSLPWCTCTLMGLFWSRLVALKWAKASSPKSSRLGQFCISTLIALI